MAKVHRMQGPVFAGPDPNESECFLYIKYKVHSEIPDGSVILPPCVQDWVQVVMFLGDSSLEVDEFDFIYGGSNDQQHAMVQQTEQYLATLKANNVIQSYMLDAKDNPHFYGAQNRRNA